MSSLRGRKDGARSIRDRAAGSRSRSGDWLTPAAAGPTPRDASGEAHARPRRAGAEGSRQIPGWLRVLFFLPAGPARMAHRDPHPADDTRHMAHQPLPDHPAWWPANEAGRSTRRHFHRSDQRRREAAAMLGLLLVASAFSIAGPITGLGTEPDPTPIYIMAGGPDDAAATRHVGSGQALVPVGTTALDTVATPLPTPVPTKKPAPKPVRVRTFVALGDSLTAWPAYNPWPTRLDAQDSVLRLVKNAGVPGNTTSQMRARLARDVYPYKPEVLLVLGGTNDLGYGISESAIIANLRAIVIAAKAHKIMPIIINVPPDSYPSMASKIKSLNKAILVLANAQKIHVVDMYRALANSSGTIRPEYTSDGLHFSDLGCQAAANQIRAQLRKLGL